MENSSSIFRIFLKKRYIFITFIQVLSVLIPKDYFFSANNSLIWLQNKLCWIIFQLQFLTPKSQHERAERVYHMLFHFTKLVLLYYEEFKKGFPNPFLNFCILLFHPSILLLKEWFEASGYIFYFVTNIAVERIQILWPSIAYFVRNSSILCNSWIHCNNYEWLKE